MRLAGELVLPPEDVETPKDAAAAMDAAMRDFHVSLSKRGFTAGPTVEYRWYVRMLGRPSTDLVEWDPGKSLRGVADVVLRVWCEVQEKTT